VPDLLVVLRVLHFASNITVAGAAFFPAGVAREQLEAHAEAFAPIQRQLDWIVLISLGLAVASGGLWLLLLASELAQVTEDADSTVWLVLTGTQFGRVSVVRLVIAGLLALLIALRYRKSFLSTLNWLIALLGIAFAVGLAWCGHSGAGIGLSGDFQVGADAVHLATAAIWVGGLLPLLLFIRPSVTISATDRYKLVRWFSLLATWAVALLIASGIVNTWYMTDGMRHLFGTEYGSLVLAKVGLLERNGVWFASMQQKSDGLMGAGKRGGSYDHHRRVPLRSSALHDRCGTDHSTSLLVSRLSIHRCGLRHGQCFLPK